MSDRVLTDREGGATPTTIGLIFGCGWFLSIVALVPAIQENTPDARAGCLILAAMGAVVMGIAVGLAMKKLEVLAIKP
jgi:hypothetical protein